MPADLLIREVVNSAIKKIEKAAVCLGILNSNRRQRMKHGLARVILAGAVAAATMMSGCSTIEGAVTDSAIRLIEQKSVVEFQKVEDVNMGCSSTVALVPFMAGLRGFYGDPGMVESVLYAGAAVCSDVAATEEELRYLRAQRDKRPDEALDARIAQKRWIEISSRRQYASFERMRQHIERKYFIKYGETCPSYFSREVDELEYLLGMIAGLQAVQNDIASQQAVGVPTDIVPKTGAAARCLSNEKWWGVPQAIRALVWSSLPGGAEGKDVKGNFDAAMALGEKGGVRLAHVMAATSATSADDQEWLRAVIRRFASAKDYRPSKDYRFLDEISLALIQGMSDRLWTQNTGSRTPTASLGKFWNDAAAQVDVDDYLNTK